jgi:hypothetical protein
MKYQIYSRDLEDGKQLVQGTQLRIDLYDNTSLEDVKELKGLTYKEYESGHTNEVKTVKYIEITGVKEDIKIEMMTKKEFDKVISKLDRNGADLEELTLRCTIWHTGWGLSLETDIIDNENNQLIDGIANSINEELEDNEENLKELKKEQKKIVNKLKKWNDNYNIKIVVDEQNC